MKHRNIAQNLDLTNGPIVKQVILFALPLFAGSLIQQLYNTVDLMFIGKLLGTQASAAVGACGLLINCIIDFFTGLSVGIGVIAAQAVGSGDQKALHKTIHNAAGMTGLFALVFTVLGIWLAPVFLAWLDTPADIIEHAAQYLRIYLLSLFSIVSYNIGSGILRALGNSRSPMVYQLIGGIANIFGNTVFIYFLDWGIPGAALSTICAQSIAAFLTVRKLCTSHSDVRLEFRKITLERTVCIRILSIGIPAAVQAIVITLSNLIIQANINMLGVESIAAFTAYFKLEGFVYLPIMAFGQTCSTFVSQNIGAGQVRRAKKGIRTVVGIGVITTLTTSGLILIFSEFLFGLFSNDPAVISLGMQIAFIAFPLYFLYVFLEVLGSAIRGAGHALPAMVIILLNMCVIRTLLLWIMMRISPSVTSVAAIYPMTWICTVACMTLYYRSNRWVPKTS